jgi:hypothetical protein
MPAIHGANAVLRERAHVEVMGPSIVVMACRFECGFACKR